jgi:NAD+ kinase
MRVPTEVPRRFAISYHPQADASTLSQAVHIQQKIEQEGLSVVRSAPLCDSFLQDEISQKAYDVLIVLGGDGSMLRASHLCAAINLPILGINIGRFGFLTEVRDGLLDKAFHMLLEGDYRLEDRMMLRAELWREGQTIQTWNALNEVAVSRGFDVRPIILQADVDGYLLSKYVADGLLVATATGSTAYALAAGGPILPPELCNILIIPVAPHLSMDRAVVLSKDSYVEVRAHSLHQVVLSVDGQTPVQLEPEDRVKAYAGENMVSFIRFEDPGYFYRNLTLYMERNPSTGI